MAIWRVCSSNWTVAQVRNILYVPELVTCTKPKLRNDLQPL